MTPQTRREFLKQSAAATLILGFPLLERLSPAAEPAEGKDWLAEARERIKTEKKPALVLLFPADAPGYNRMAEGLAQQLDNGTAFVALTQPGIACNHVGPKDAAVQRLFCQAIFVCLPDERGRKEFPKIKADTAIVLLGLDGEVAGELANDPELYGKDFGSKLTELLHGARGERLAAVNSAQREAIGKEAVTQLDAGLRDLAAEAFPVRQAAQKQLSPLAPRVPAALAAALRERPALDTSRRIDRLFDEIYTDSMKEKPGSRLPYGVVVQVSNANTCKCGMTFTPADARLFLRFVTEKSK